MNADSYTLRVSAFAEAAPETLATTLTLDWERRQRSRLRARFDDGREVALLLPRGTRLRDGDVLQIDGGALVLVRAAAEELSCVESTDTGLLMRACYHLANRHVPVQFDASRLCYRRDHVLDEMLRGLGMSVTAVMAPFEAEAGAYGHHADAHPDGHHDTHQEVSGAVDEALTGPAFRDTLFTVHGRSGDVARSLNAGPVSASREQWCVPHEHDAGEAETAILPDASLLSLLQLASAALPVGSFAYSQGLEQAVELGWVRDEAGALDWLLGLLQQTQACQDVPLFARLYRAWEGSDAEAIAHWNAWVIAARDSTEARAEERDTGAALARLLAALEPECRGALAPAHGDPEYGYLSLYALAAVRWRIPLEQAACGWLWSWCQQQVAAAVKLVPLGQTAAQRLLRRAAGEIPPAVAHALALADDDIGRTPPGLGMAGALHENQYTRLFLS